MAQLDREYSVDDLPAGDSYELLPPGWYNATISQADTAITKNGTGQYIKVRYDITGPTHQGRVVFGNINVQNASAAAEEIGRKQLGEIMRAIGVPRIRDTDQLIGGTLQIKVKVRTGDGKFDDQNEVSGFKPMAGAAPPSSAPFGQPAPAAPAATKSAPPWAKR
jgi:hypothetical protein